MIEFTVRYLSAPSYLRWVNIRLVHLSAYRHCFSEILSSNGPSIRPFEDMTTSKSPSSLSDPAFTLEPVGTAGLFGTIGASFAAFAAERAGGGIGFP